MATARVIVNLSDDNTYDVVIGRSPAAALLSMLEAATPYSRAVIITDSNVREGHALPVAEALREDGLPTELITVDSGESSKSIHAAAEIWEALASDAFGRDSLIVAVGGGVVGDLAGFIAATYMRGIDYLQVPTTLLAMVDSSVGGKTAINLEAGKNLVGAFKQPIGVIASPAALTTLPEREWACGFAEVAKTAMIDSDAHYFSLVESRDALMTHDEDVLAAEIARCVSFKADVVAADQDETRGIRECLNYGHTLAHAIEKISGYGTYSHGHAVAEGMRFAIRLSAALVGTDTSLVRAQDELLDSLGLPTLDFSADPQEMLDAMKGDKKNRGGHIRFVVLKDIGDWQVLDVDTDILREHLAAWAASKQGC